MNRRKRSRLIIGFVVVLAGIASVSLADSGVTPSAATRNPTAEAVPVAGVDSLMKNPEKHAGTVRVEGVVSRAYPDRQLLVLIDVEEYRKCGLANCSALILPVTWSGKMPAIKDQIIATGSIRRTPAGKMEFLATTVEKAEAGATAR